MAAGGDFGCQKITFGCISGHFRSIRNLFLIFCLQNGCRRPFWMSENHFRSHFYPFHIDMQLFFLSVGNIPCILFLIDLADGTIMLNDLESSVKVTLWS